MCLNVSFLHIFHTYFCFKCSKFSSFINSSRFCSAAYRRFRTSSRCSVLYLDGDMPINFLNTLENARKSLYPQAAAISSTERSVIVSSSFPLEIRKRIRKSLVKFSRIIYTDNFCLYKRNSQYPQPSDHLHNDF